MAQTRVLPLDVALSSVLTASLDGAARPGLLAAVSRVPAQRRSPEGRTWLQTPAQAEGAEGVAGAEGAEGPGRRS